MLVKDSRYSKNFAREVQGPYIRNQQGLAGARNKVIRSDRVQILLYFNLFVSLLCVKITGLVFVLAMPLCFCDLF